MGGEETQAGVRAVAEGTQVSERKGRRRDRIRRRLRGKSTQQGETRRVLGHSKTGCGHGSCSVSVFAEAPEVATETAGGSDVHAAGEACAPQPATLNVRFKLKGPGRGSGWGPGGQEGKGHSRVPAGRGRKETSRLSRHDLRPPEAVGTLNLD